MSQNHTAESSAYLDLFEIEGALRVYGAYGEGVEVIEGYVGYPFRVHHLASHLPQVLVGADVVRALHDALLAVLEERRRVSK